MAGDAINTWKGIAAYLGRGVRTVQRWEQELHLPVHRPRNKYRSAVIALRSDLDRWLAGTPVLKKTLVQLADSEPTEQMLQMRLQSLKEEMERLEKEIQRLRKKSAKRTANAA